MGRNSAAKTIPLTGKLDDRRNVRKQPIPLEELPPEIQRVLESKMVKGGEKKSIVRTLEGKHMLSLIIYINRMSPVIKSDILNNVTRCSSLNEKLDDIEHLGMIKTYRLARSNTIVYVATPKGKEVTRILDDLLDVIDGVRPSVDEPDFDTDPVLEGD